MFIRLGNLLFYCLVICMCMLCPTMCRAQREELDINIKSFFEDIDVRLTGSMSKMKDPGISIGWVPEPHAFARLAEIKRLQRLEIVFPDPLSLEHYQTIAKLQELRSFKTFGFKTQKEALPEIGKLKNLDTLQIWIDAPGDKSLNGLAGLQELVRLRLTCDRYTDEGILALTRLRKLAFFHAYVDQFTETMAENLAAMENLESLSVNAARTTPEALQKLSANPALKRLTLGGSGMTDENLAEFATARPVLLLNASQSLLEQPFARKGKQVGELIAAEDSLELTFRWEEEAQGKKKKRELVLEATGEPEAKLSDWAVSPDGKLLALGRSLNKKTKSEVKKLGWLDVFNLETGKRLANEELGLIEGVGFLRDGRTVVYRQGEKLNEEF